MDAVNEQLEKSLDEAIENFFTEEVDTEESVEKAQDAITQIVGDGPKAAARPKDEVANQSATTADDPKNSPSESKEEDEKAGKKRGRPEDLSQMAERNMSTGESTNEGYDMTIAEGSADGTKSEDSQVKPPRDYKGEGSDASANDTGKGPQSAASQASSQDPRNPETEQVSPPAYMKKADEEVTVSKKEFEEMKKAWEEKLAKEKEEVLTKARQEQTDLIKSAVSEATSEIREELKKTSEKLEKANETIEKIARQPKGQKAITSVQALEKGGYSPEGESKPEFFQKSQVLDVIEELVKSKQLTMEQAIEYETTNTLIDSDARRLVERKLKGN